MAKPAFTVLERTQRFEEEKWPRHLPRNSEMEVLQCVTVPQQFSHQHTNEMKSEAGHFIVETVELTAAFAASSAHYLGYQYDLVSKSG